mmetsp:Transcript_9135/g.18971  ORF Transcript_9135/g.18971 Transcript_9135/m.18971 type:complete len:327 (-) Transcript_9135:861-1841(-)
MIDGIAEREEGITANCHTTRFLEECVLFFCRQRFWNSGELGFPANFFFSCEVPFNITDTGVDSVLTLDSVLELKSEDFGVLSKVPRRNLATRKFHTIDPALLPSSNAHHHTILGKANRIALCILDANRCHNQVAFGVVAQHLLRRDNVGHMILTNHNVITFLRKGHAIHFTVFKFSGIVVGSCFQNDKFASLFGLEDLQGRGCVRRGYNSIAHLLFQNFGSIFINFIRHGAEIPKAAHGISISSSQVGQSCGCESCSIFRLNFVSLTFHVLQRNCNSSSSRTDMLKTSSCSQTSSLLQFNDQLPSIGSVQQVNVARGSILDIKWKF